MTRRLPLVALTVLGLAAPAVAQPKPPAPTVLHLRPAREPVPALKDRFLPELGELTPGNAAIGYHRAIEMVLQRHQDPSSPEAEKREKWLHVPIAELPRDEVRTYLGQFTHVFNEIDLAAHQERCDWEFTSRMNYEFLLPEIQNARELARLVTLRSRLAVADGKIGEAVRSIRTGLALARHVGEGPSVIQTLVGVACAQLTLQTIEDLIQAQGTPSFYWPLTDLPHPFIGLRTGLEGERMSFEHDFPIFRQLESSTMGPEAMRNELNAMLRKLQRLTDSPGNRPAWQSQVGFAVLVARAYPKARRELIERGRSPAEVEAMPAVQVVAIQSYRNYLRIRENMFKWMNLPYWQAYKGLEQADRETSAWAKSMEGIPLAALLPAMRSVYVAQIRADRRIAALRCIEAIRMHAAEHGGKLPGSLSDVTVVPVPDDPVTGKPFEYDVSDAKATLSAPPPPGMNVPAYALRYELILQP